MGCLIGDFKYIVKVTDNIAKDKLKKRNIPVLSQHIIIFHLINNQHILFSNLQKELQCSKSTLSDAINKYEELGLIDRFNCEKDKRNLYVTLTKNGKETLSQLITIDEEIKTMMFKNFNIKDIKHTEEITTKIVENLK